jgi:hypothetical protein
MLKNNCMKVITVGACWQPYLDFDLACSTWHGTGGHRESFSFSVTNNIVVNVECWQPFVIHCEHTGYQYHSMLSFHDSIKLILNKANHLENVSVMGLDCLSFAVAIIVPLVTT